MDVDKSSNVLTWEGRLQIATDAAQGLQLITNILNLILATISSPCITFQMIFEMQVWSICTMVAYHL